MNSSPSAYQILVEEHNKVKSELNNERQIRVEAERSRDKLERDSMEAWDGVKEKDT